VLVVASVLQILLVAVSEVVAEEEVVPYERALEAVLGVCQVVEVGWAMYHAIAVRRFADRVDPQH
jgi:hypothetical protein